MDTDNLFRLRLSAELLTAINEQATLLKVKPQDVARLALAVGIQHISKMDISKRDDWPQAA